MAVVVETTIGDFTIDLYVQERPQTCRNFLKLCKVKYYNWNLFHTVQSNFIAQTGDPTGTGKFGESIYGKILGEKARYYESEQMPKIKHDRVGLLSMVNCGSNMLGSQFFITLGPELRSLDGEHCVFGEIAEGLEIILKLNETICDVDHRPYQDIRISHTVVLEDPFDDPQGLIVPDASPEPTADVLMSDRIGADEVIDDTAGMTVEEINEMQKEKEAKARATILEIVGDIPDADMAPPENVLFVCKLNPVTNDDDLEIIFSRFGKIVGCEVIRDRQTGDSLQYAFIEFAERKSCEEAYFKMDNVLIDDRRIHVDFSQSVAKMRWRGKGKGIRYFDEEEDANGKGENIGDVQTRRDHREKRRRNGQNETYRSNDKRSSRKDEREYKEHKEYRKFHDDEDEHRNRSRQDDDKRERRERRDDYKQEYNSFGEKRRDRKEDDRDEGNAYAERREKRSKRDEFSPSGDNKRDRRDDRINYKDERSSAAAKHERRDKRDRGEYRQDGKHGNRSKRREEGKERNRSPADERHKRRDERKHKDKHKDKRARHRSNSRETVEDKKRRVKSRS